MAWLLWKIVFSMVSSKDPGNLSVFILDEGDIEGAHCLMVYCRRANEECFMFTKRYCIWSSTAYTEELHSIWLGEIIALRKHLDRRGS
jgi:hypothetical protein